MLEAGSVLVDGRPRGAAYRVRAGELLAVAARPRADAGFAATDVAVVAEAGDYAAVVKPAGLHSASIAQGGGPSLEDLLPAIFPGRDPILLSRLDRLTTGLVPVAFTPEAADAYRSLETAGAVAKTYMAVAHGVIGQPFEISYDLDVRDRIKTRVRLWEAADPLRRTAVTPVAGARGLALVRCRIARGARHQIRAHLAAAGHPLVGDPLYGQGEGERLFLHCAALRCPVLAADDDPPWTLADAVRVIEAREDGGRTAPIRDDAD